MIRTLLWPCLVTSACLVGCADRGSGSAATNASATTAAPPPAAAPSVDDEYEQLKRATPVDACALLTSEKLRAIFPDQTFSVHDKLAPQLSGYVWDSRCTQWAVGDGRPDVPTHSVDVFVGTAANEEKAKRNLARRQETAVEATGYRAQPELGPNAYAILGTGFARVFFVKGQGEIQVNVSYLKGTADERLAKAVKLAQSL